MKNYGELYYQTCVSEVLRILNQWNDKSKNKELEEFSKHIVQIVSYTAGLHVEKRGYEKAVEEYRLELIKTINKLKQHNESGD